MIEEEYDNYLESLPSEVVVQPLISRAIHGYGPINMSFTLFWNGDYTVGYVSASKDDLNIIYNIPDSTQRREHTITISHWEYIPNEDDPIYNEHVRSLIFEVITRLLHGPLLERFLDVNKYQIEKLIVNDPDSAAIDDNGGFIYISDDRIDYNRRFHIIYRRDRNSPIHAVTYRNDSSDALPVPRWVYNKYKDILDSNVENIDLSYTVVEEPPTGFRGIPTGFSNARF